MVNKLFKFNMSKKELFLLPLSVLIFLQLLHLVSNGTTIMWVPRLNIIVINLKTTIKARCHFWSSHSLNHYILYVYKSLDSSICKIYPSLITSLLLCCPNLSFSSFLPNASSGGFWCSIPQKNTRKICESCKFKFFDLTH